MDKKCNNAANHVIMPAVFRAKARSFHCLSLTKQFPQCGFSARAVQILQNAGCNDFVTVNVLENDEVRQGIKEYSNWPTIPQLYVNGEFLGGSDIMMEMFEAGELEEALKA